MNERSEPTIPKPNYLAVFAVLAVLTAVEVGLVFTGAAQSIQVVLLIALAFTKAMLVALYYMHLKFEGPLIRIIAAVPVLLLLVVVMIPIFDVWIFG